MGIFDTYTLPLRRDDAGRLEWPIRDGRGHRMSRPTTLRMEQILWCLADQPGQQITDKSGQATGTLLAAIGPSPSRKSRTEGQDEEAARRSDVSNLSQTLQFLERAGLIARMVNGKRTHRIKLLEPLDLLPPRPGTETVEEGPLEATPAPEAPEATTAEPEPEPEPEAPEEPEEARPPFEDVLAERRAARVVEVPSIAAAVADLGMAGLARALLDEVVAVLATERAGEAATTPSPAPAADAGTSDAGWIRAQRDDATAKLKRAERRVQGLESDLAVKVGHNKSLQHQLAEVVRERDALRANLEAVLASAREAASHDEAAHKELDRVMRTAPGFQRYLRDTPPPPPKFHSQRAGGSVR